MKIKKAVLTGGGRATRLRPITTTINKHLIPLANKPMIFHAIEKVVAAGVEEIFINTNPGETELQKQVGDGGHWGAKIIFFEQQGGPQGVAHVVKQAEKFIGADPFLFYLSDNIILGSVKEMADEFAAQNFDCMLALAKVPDPERFGVPYFDAGGRLVDVKEKPQNPPNNFAVTGIYLYGPRVFFGAFDKIQKSPRGEYEISDIHSQFLKSGLRVGYKEITGWWKDTGKPDDLIMANRLLLEQLPADYFANNIAAERVRVGAGTQIGAGVKFVGPAIVGENCLLENCVLGPNVTVGAGTAVKGAEISDAIIFSNCKIEAPIKIQNSIIGEKASVIKSLCPAHRLIIGDNTWLEV